MERFLVYIILCTVLCSSDSRPRIAKCFPSLLVPWHQEHFVGTDDAVVS